MAIHVPIFVFSSICGPSVSFYCFVSQPCCIKSHCVIDPRKVQSNFVFFSICRFCGKPLRVILLYFLISFSLELIFKSHSNIINMFLMALFICPRGEYNSLLQICHCSPFSSVSRKILYFSCIVCRSINCII